MPRLSRLAQTQPVPLEEDTDENFVLRVEDTLEEAANDGAILAELRFGREHVLRPDFMSLFREGEARVRRRHPGFHGAAVATIVCSMNPERLQLVVDACVLQARSGLGGIDLLYSRTIAKPIGRPCS